MKSSLLIFILVNIIYINKANKLTVDAFIESQCPDCVEFMSNSVKKAL